MPSRRGPAQQSDDRPSDPCPITPAVEVIFSKWAAPILWALMHGGPMRFNELRRTVPDIAAKVLVQRLRQLEQDGLVTRKDYAEVPARVEYQATNLAQTLSPVFGALEEWSTAHLGEVAVARGAYSGPLSA